MVAEEAVAARRRVSDILEERRRRRGIGVRPRAADLEWEAIESLDGEVSEMRQGLSKIQGDIAFVARMVRLVTVGAPTAAAIAVVLSYAGVL